MLHPLNHLDRQSHRMARRVGMSYYITLDGNLVPPGYREEVRPATDAELEMWSKLVPSEWVPQESVLRGEIPAPAATPEEMRRMLQVPGPVTISVEDYAILLGMGASSIKHLHEPQATRGFVGVWATTTPVWVSPHIPTGYYWRGTWGDGPKDHASEAVISVDLETYSL